MRSFSKIGLLGMGMWAAAMAALALGVDHPPMDHGGASLVLADGDRIWGEHTGLTHFEIPATATVTIRAYSPDTPTVQQTGRLSVHAETILITGVLDATGAGYTGGGGFGGEKGPIKECTECPDIFYESASDGARGRARYGDDESDGPARGVNPGQDGGYDIVAANADATTTPEALLGSGGQGGEGGDATPPDPVPWQEGSTGGAGGGGGGPGGGAVMLFAADSLTLTGMVLTCGRTGENGFHGEEALLADTCDINDIFNRPCLAHHEADGSDGGGTDAGFQQPEDGSGGRNGDGSFAQDGGAGGGGGIVLFCESPGGLSVTGELDARGGRAQLVNGGTVKAFYRLPVTFAPSEIYAPRLFMRNLDGSPSGENAGWMLR